MSLLDAKEWFEIADEDLDSAKFLTNKQPKPLEIICYHCAQAVEKYLKGFISYNGHIPEKTHDLMKLINKCITYDNSFNTITKDCDLINRYTNEIRYPDRAEVTENDMELCIRITDRIKSLPILVLIRKEIANSKI